MYNKRVSQMASAYIYVCVLETSISAAAAALFIGHCKNKNDPRAAASQIK
jgi:hypothetical protein